MPDPGTVIDGRYRVGSRIGTGGMADVFLAEDLQLGRQVALKILHRRFAEDQEFVERFRREASSAAGLSHPNIVHVFDRGEWDGTYYIAMEYLPGESLKTLVRREARSIRRRRSTYVIQILRAARFAHQRGVIHRDLKPHNVIVDDEGRCKRHRLRHRPSRRLGHDPDGLDHGHRPVSVARAGAGPRRQRGSDLYAIGIVLYELLTGTLPFDGETAVTIALKQVSEAPMPPSAVNPAVPAALDAIVLRALAKDPQQRFADAGTFIAALEEVRAGLRSARCRGHRPLCRARARGRRRWRRRQPPGRPAAAHRARAAAAVRRRARARRGRGAPPPPAAAVADRGRGGGARRGRRRRGSARASVPGHRADARPLRAGGGRLRPAAPERAAPGPCNA